MKIPLPLEALDDRLAIVGRSGYGKTNAAKVMAEKLLSTGARVCILDPTDSWWGLRLKPDGKGAGWPVAIFGGAHGGDSRGAPRAQGGEVKPAPVYPSVPRLLPDASGYACDQCGQEWKAGESPSCDLCVAAWVEIEKKDICQCGDYRHQHDSAGCKVCRWNGPARCHGFRLYSSALVAKP